MNTEVVARNNRFTLNITTVNSIYGGQISYPIWTITNAYGNVLHCYSGANAGTHARQMWATRYSRSSRNTFVNEDFAHMSSLNG